MSFEVALQKIWGDVGKARAEQNMVADLMRLGDKYGEQVEEMRNKFAREARSEMIHAHDQQANHEVDIVLAAFDELAMKLTEFVSFTSGRSQYWGARRESLR